jgi:hypothetical protein
LVVYIARGIWNFLTSKRVEIPEIKYDVTDNPILSLKNRLGQAYVASHDQTVKKLLHRLLEYVEVIEEWHNAKVHLAETKCDTYRTKAARTEVELRVARSKNEELTKQLNESEKCLNHSLEREANLRKANEGLNKLLKEEQENNKIPRFIISDDDEPDYLIEKRFPGQTDPFIKITMDEEALKQSIPMNTGAIIHIDSEDLNRYSVGRGPDGNLLKDEPPIYSEEFNKKLRDWWGLDADTNKWPDFMMQVNCVPKEWNRYRVTVRNKCGATSTVHEWAPNPGYFINKFKESNYTVLSYDLDNPVYRGEESTT